MVKFSLTVIAPAIVLAFLVGDEPQPPRTLVPCTLNNLHDGDTLNADVQFPWGVVLDDQSVRCLGYDAWEISRNRRTVRVTAAEIEKGKAAQVDLQGLLNGADAVYLSPGDEDRDPYGRLLAYLVVWDEGELIEVADWMKQRGHTRN